MKLTLSFIFFCLMLSALALLFLFLFNRPFYRRCLGGFFSNREFWVMPLFNLAQILPYFAVFIKASFKPYVFMDQGLSGVVYLFAGLIYPLLCLSVIPYKILKREYSATAQIRGLVILLFSMPVGVAAFLGGVKMEFLN